MTTARANAHKWTDEQLAMLGVLPDYKIASIIDRGVKCVRRKRESLGIPAVAAIEARVFTAEENALLGTASDRAVAEKLGVSQSIVSRRRRALEIPPSRSSGLPEPTEVDLAAVAPEEFPVESDGLWWKLCPVGGEPQSYKNEQSARRAARMNQMCQKCIKTEIWKGRKPGRGAMHRGIRVAWFNEFEANARRRDISFSITIDYVADLYEKQKGLCALTGWEIPMSSTDPANSIRASIDRIDSSLDYEEGNIQIVDGWVNVRKHTASQEEFIAMCRAVAAKHPE